MRKVFKQQDIPYAELKRVGLPQLKDEDLNALLSGGRTGIVRLKNFEEDGIKVMNLDAKLSLRQNEHGGIDLLYHPIYREVTEPEYLTDQEADKLMKGEIASLDKVISIDGKNKEVLIEFDRDTNEFIITDTEHIFAPDLVNDEELSPEQKLRFKKGKEVELADGTKFRYTNTDPSGLRSNKLHLVASIIVDGGLSYLLYKGLKALGPQEPKVSEDYSRGFYNAMEDMNNQQVKDRMSGRNVQSR
jgi:hypothetical protein